jgi:hypothetical protein
MLMVTRSGSWYIPHRLMVTYDAGSWPFYLPYNARTLQPAIPKSIAAGLGLVPRLANTHVAAAAAAAAVAQSQGIGAGVGSTAAPGNGGISRNASFTNLNVSGMGLGGGGGGGLQRTLLDDDFGLGGGTPIGEVLCVHNLVFTSRHSLQPADLLQISCPLPAYHLRERWWAIH